MGLSCVAWHMWRWGVNHLLQIRLAFKMPDTTFHIDVDYWNICTVDIKNILQLLIISPWRDSASDALDLLKPLKRLHYFISHNKVIIVHIDRYQVVIWCVSTTLGWTRLSRWAVLWWPWRVVRHCLWWIKNSFFCTSRFIYSFLKLVWSTLISSSKQLFQ